MGSELWYLQLELVIRHILPHLSPLQSAGPVGGGGEPVHGGTGGAPVCSDHLAPGDGGQGAGHGAASDQHLQYFRTQQGHNVTKSHTYCHRFLPKCLLILDMEKLDLVQSCQLSQIV